MKQTEVIKLIGICSVNYKNWPEKDKEEMLISLWMTMLADTEYYIAEAAVQKFISESVFPPTVADIRARIADLTVLPEKTAIEAWGEVKRAIGRYGNYREKEAMDSLMGVTRKVVEAIGFRTLCLSENEMADRAHFLKVYDILVNRERQEATMLPQIKDMLEFRGMMGRIKARTVDLPEGVEEEQAYE